MSAAVTWSRESAGASTWITAQGGMLSGTTYAVAVVATRTVSGFAAFHLQTVGAQLEEWKSCP